MKPTFFATPARFRRWLERHHDSAAELWVGFYKKGSGRPSITWPESVDEALCFGWIDGIRKSLDDDSYVIRFTPRRRGSNWSAVNTRRATELIAEGRMRPAGLAAFEARDPAKAGVYSFEQRASARLDAAAEATFRKNRAAWRFFESLAPGYRRIALWWVISAKRAETRERRLQTLIADCAAGRKIGQLRRAGE
ncbi:MAG TPA: YdeI/OmpD-associated family protein [Gemmatimonadaceae bacterium]|nr:YdeI/OmpD-associated family protein [Gemmatimonadaceae bacterium]